MVRQLATGLLLAAVACSVAAQVIEKRDGDGYTGYHLQARGDGDSAVYQTENTNTQVAANATYGPPDVYLNASVHVGDIGIDVQNLTAKLNLDAQVLSLLQFGAGVDVSVDRVNLVIQNVTAKVLLEARLGNLVSMVSNVLDSIDLNPLIITAGKAVGQIGETVGGAVGDAGGAVGGAVGGALGGGGSSSGGNGTATTPSNSTASTGSTLALRAIVDEIDRVLFSKNDYSGNTHTNRVLEDDGSIVDQFLDNDGRVRGQQVIGDYTTEFSYTGDEKEVTVEDRVLREREYEYNPFAGLKIRSLVYLDAQDRVVSTQVLSEVYAGGTSTVSGD